MASLNRSANSSANRSAIGLWVRIVGFGLALAGSVGGCKAGGECGDVKAQCEAKCGGTEADNICYTHLCSEGTLVCNCKQCTFMPRDLSAIDQSQPKD